MRRCALAARKIAICHRARSCWPLSRVTFAVYLQGELNDCGQSSERGPYSPPVSIDDRPADREPHTHALGLGGVKGVKQTVKTLRAKSRAGILHRDDHRARCFL